MPEVQAKVAAIAKEWEEVANLTLEFVTAGAAEIRISFAEKGFSWSTVGTDALTVPAHRGDDELRLARADDRAARVPARRAPRVRPRARHDPRAPEPGRPGQDPVGQAEGRTPTTPSRAGRRTTSTSTSSRSTTRTARTTPTFDPTSIMEYAIPDSLTIGSYSIGWNTELSAPDASSCAAVPARRRRHGRARPSAGRAVGGRPRRRRRGRHLPLRRCRRPRRTS